MTKKEMKQLISNKGLTKEVIKGLKKNELVKLEDVLMDADANKYVDEMLELTTEAIASLDNVKRDEDVKKVASEKSKKVEAPKAPKNNKKKVEAPKVEDKKEAPKEDKKKETPKVDDKKKEAPKDEKVDFSKFNGYQLERIFRSPFSALSKEDKKVHTALNKEYDNLKKGDKVAISVKGDVNGEYAVANCLIVYRDAVSAIAVDVETSSKYEINRIKWALKTDFKHTIHEDGTVTTMELNIEPIK